MSSGVALYGPMRDRTYEVWHAILWQRMVTAQKEIDACSREVVFDATKPAGAR